MSLEKSIVRILAEGFSGRHGDCADILADPNVSSASGAICLGTPMSADHSG